MAKDIAPPLDENTRRYYLDVMGVQCWELLDPPQQKNDQRNDHGIAAVEPVPEADGRAENNTDVTAVNWSQLEENIQQCKQCALHQTRQQALSGRGNRSAELMFVLLSPSVSDDESGLICSGESNELFGKMLAAINIDIGDVYISSLLKCAVPAKHTVSPKEIQSCSVHLRQQIQLIQPKLLVVLGETAVRCLLQKDLSIDDYRAMNPGMNNQGQQYQVEAIPVFSSYSPEELLRQPENKRKAWSDLQQLQNLLQQPGK